MGLLRKLTISLEINKLRYFIIYLKTNSIWIKELRKPIKYLEKTEKNNLIISEQDKPSQACSQGHAKNKNGRIWSLKHFKTPH